MISDFFGELTGTFIIISTVLISGNPLVIVFIILSCIYIFGLLSKACFNPAVSLALFIRKDLDLLLFITYIVAQLLAAVLAFIPYKHTYSYWHNNFYIKK